MLRASTAIRPASSRSSRDTGIGIGPDLLPRIFEPFTQGDASIARSEGGLGIGLAMARKLVEMHGGTIEAHSSGPETGGEFVVYLPLYHADGAGAPRDMA